MNSPEFKRFCASRELFAWCSLIVLGLLAFWPAVWFDFVNWDDPAYVWNNDLIKSWSLSSLYGVATETVTRNYAPLTIGSLLIDYTLWGMQPSGFHATNVLLHLVNGLLVFTLVRQLSCSLFVSWLTAALFLVHPVQIETVAWISSRKGLLSATFMLVALIVRLRPAGDTRAPAIDARQDLWYVVWLAAALLSKALAVVVPPVVLLYDTLVQRRRFGESLARQVIPGLMSLLLLFKTMAAQHTVLGGLRGHMDLSLLQILAVDVTILWQYIGMLIWPSDLCVLYDPPTSDIAGAVAAAAVGWAVVCVLVWRLRRRWPMLFWGAATFMLLLLPVLNFFRITTLMNDRYLYLPCILFFGFASSGLNQMLAGAACTADWLLRWSAGVTRWSTGFAVVVASLLATAEHLPVWQNSFTLWNHAMSEVPQLPVVHMQLALTHYDCGRKREAVRILQRALLECQPADPDRKRMKDAAQQWLEELGQRTAVRLPVHQ